MATYSPLHDDEAVVLSDLNAESQTSPARTQQPTRGPKQKSKRAAVTKSARTLIVLACVATTIPICGIIIALLVVIYSHRVERNADDGLLLSDAPKNQTCDAPALLVDFSATTLVIPGTWISTIANLVAGFLMFLLSFSLARKIKIKSTHRTSELPTPKQLSLLIGVASGGIGPLWDWTLYTFGWRKQRVRRMSKELKTAVSVLVTLLIFGVLLQLADLWFHEATKTVLWNSVQTVPASGHEYGRQISPQCLTEYHREIDEISTPIRDPQTNDRVPCPVGVGDLLFYLRNPAEGYGMTTGSGVNSTIAMANSTSGPIAVLIPAKPDPAADWRADTIGVSTQCKNILPDCEQFCDTAMLENCEFTCNATTGYPGNFTGEFGGYKTRANTTVSFNWTMTPNTMPPETANIMYNAPNPFNHSIQAFAQGQLLAGLDKDPRMITANFFYSYSLLQCSTAVYNLTYRSVNGTVSIEKTLLSSTEISQNINGPLVFMLGRPSDTPGIGSIMRSEYVSALFSANSTAELERKYADAHSKITLGFGAAALQNADVSAYQVRNQRLLACVPQAPLWTLIALALLLVFAAITLTVLALLSLDDDVADLQAKLSIAGLTVMNFEHIPSDELTGSAAANQPEEVDKLFAEYHGPNKDAPLSRVGFERKRIGWLFSIHED